MRTARRDFLAAGLASLGSVALGARGSARAGSARVVVIGGGFGGATAAKYIRKWSDGSIDVVLIEREREFVSCPMSNLVLGGSLQLSDITRSYDGLEKWGVRHARDEAVSIPTSRPRK